MYKGRPGGYTALATPLAQVEAAYEFCEAVDAFLQDEWTELFTDPPPEAEEGPMGPFEILDTLGQIGFRFELSGYARGADEYGDGYWCLRYQGTSLDVLFHGWAHEVMDHFTLDPRAFTEGLRTTDFIFVPDETRIASRGFELILDALGRREKVEERQKDIEKIHRRNYRERDGLLVKRRGEGPRSKSPVMADKVAICLRDADVALSPEEIARRIRHKNIPSVTAALHQIVTYRKPKRLTGWVVRAADGKYAWAGDAT